MASDGHDIEPLLQHSGRPPPEHHDVTILTPSEFKNRLLYGSQRDSSPSSSSATSLSDYSTTLNLLRSSQRAATAPAATAFATNDPTTPPIDRETEQSSDPNSIARQSVAMLIVYLSLGVLIYWLNRDGYALKNQTHPVVDGLYFCIVTMCTIGYGDITPDSVTTKLLSILFVLGWFVLMNTFLSSGILTYFLDLQESYIYRNSRSSYIFDVRKGRMKTRVKVALALGVVILSLGLGVLIMHFVERIGWLDSFYYSFMSVTTIGYGGREAFKTLTGRLLAAIWMLLSTFSLVGAVLYLAEARKEKTSRKMAKRVLSENMSVAQFFAADIDRSGCVSKEDFVIYKLKEMGRITSEDIRPILNQFDKLDPSNSGRIAPLDLSTATFV
ncbi:unnamed protein product [Microthlaspi erraticum]|uniref:Potassium channel domain-containing protein n=1 Tax=Microthlaspi erraticum TaxID=1685480 RepID=A0A6D2L6N1_9BRAS|nr:unnamed protein product [Microthlaspi erraticum]